MQEGLGTRPGCYIGCDEGIYIFERVHCGQLGLGVGLRTNQEPSFTFADRRSVIFFSSVKPRRMGY